MTAIFQNIFLAFRTLWASKLRSFLTMLGVIIGVFAIIALIGIGQGVKKSVSKEVTQLGSNLIIVLPGKIQGQNGSYNPTASLGASTLTNDDVTALRALPSITDGTPVSLLGGVVTNGQLQTSGLNLGVEPSYFSLFTTAKLVAGRVLTEDDVVHQRPVIVMDTGPRTALFPAQDVASVIGRTVQLSGTDFTVVGLLETPPSNSIFGGSGPSFASATFIPYTSAEKYVKNTQIFRVILQSDKNLKTKDVAANVKETMLQQHHQTEDFTVFTQDDILKVIDNILSLITTAIVGISSISLIVGGIGIMNIMLVSVTERTKEIGLRKAVGASDSNILLQFLTEAVILGLLGGAIGVGAAALAGIPVHAKTGIDIVIDVHSVLLAVAFSVGVGVIFGVAPAIRASRLNPIEALRYE